MVRHVCACTSGHMHTLARVHTRLHTGSAYAHGYECTLGTHVRWHARLPACAQGGTHAPHGTQAEEMAQVKKAEATKQRPASAHKPKRVPAGDSDKKVRACMLAFVHAHTCVNVCMHGCCMRTHARMYACTHFGTCAHTCAFTR